VEFAFTFLDFQGYVTHKTFAIKSFTHIIMNERWSDVSKELKITLILFWPV